MRAAVALLLIVAPLFSYAAPIPPPKAKPRPDLSGAWVAHWAGSEWPTILLPEGGYVAERPGGPRYEGRWKLAGHKLQIEERLVGPDGYGEVYRYTFTLRAGTLRASQFDSTCGGLRLVSVR
jgi:hypothetical protein